MQVLKNGISSLYFMIISACVVGLLNYSLCLRIGSTSEVELPRPLFWSSSSSRIFWAYPFPKDHTSSKTTALQTFELVHNKNMKKKASKMTIQWQKTSLAAFTECELMCCWDGCKWCWKKSWCFNWNNRGGGGSSILSNNRNLPCK